MKNLLVLISIVFCSQANSQFVTEVYDAYNTVTKAEKVGQSLYKDLLKFEWQLGYDDITIFPEELKIPCIEMGVSHIDTTKKNKEYYGYHHDFDFPHVMYMFDKTKGKEVRSFFTEVIDEDELVFYETRTSIVVLSYSLEENNKKEKKQILELVKILEQLFKKYYDDI